jgi:shikimate kinase
VSDVDKVYLVGFMGAGKSTLARALADRLGWVAEDVDDRIELRERATIADIFRLKGEPYFRTVERDVLYSLLPLRQAVVATGGGTFVDPENRAAMLADGLVVWLDIPLPLVVDRAPTDGRRPLAVDRRQLEGLYWARTAAYRLAHVRIDTAGLPVGELVERIMETLRP